MAYQFQGQRSAVSEVEQPKFRLTGQPIHYKLVSVTTTTGNLCFTLELMYALLLHALDGICFSFCLISNELCSECIYQLILEILMRPVICTYLPTVMILPIHVN